MATHIYIHKAPVRTTDKKITDYGTPGMKKGVHKTEQPTGKLKRKPVPRRYDTPLSPITGQPLGNRRGYELEHLKKKSRDEDVTTIDYGVKGQKKGVHKAVNIHKAMPEEIKATTSKPKRPLYGSYSTKVKPNNLRARLAKSYKKSK